MDAPPSVVVIMLATLAGGCLDLTDGNGANGDERQPSAETDGSAGATTGGGGGSLPGGAGGSGGGTVSSCAQVSEQEPNQTGASNQPVIGCGSVISGNFATDMDLDRYILNVVNDDVLVTLETFDRTGACDALATKLTLTEAPSSSDVAAAWDLSFHNGIKNCSAITEFVKAGFYYVVVEKDTIPALTSDSADYLLQVRCHTKIDRDPSGPTELPDVNGDLFVGGNLGGQLKNFFSVELREGQSLRAELMHPTSCSDFDSRLTLTYPGNGGAIESNSGSLSQCAVIDGTDSSKGPGKYTLEVYNAQNNSFNYTLAVSIREDTWCSAEKSTH